MVHKISSKPPMHEFMPGNKSTKHKAKKKAKRKHNPGRHSY